MSHAQTALCFDSVKASASVNGVNSDTARAVRGGRKYGRFQRLELCLESFME